MSRRTRKMNGLGADLIQGLSHTQGGRYIPVEQLARPTTAGSRRLRRHHDDSRYGVREDPARVLATAVASEELGGG